MLLPLRGTPRIDILRDGGSICVDYTDFWGRRYCLSLPVKRSFTPDKTMTVVGYAGPLLDRYDRVPRISKGNGIIYYVTTTTRVQVSHQRALRIARKIERALVGTPGYELAVDLIIGIKTGVQPVNR